MFFPSLTSSLGNNHILFFLGKIRLWPSWRNPSQSDQRTRFGCKGKTPAPSQAGELRAGPKGMYNAVKSNNTVLLLLV